MLNYKHIARLSTDQLNKQHKHAQESNSHLGTDCIHGWKSTYCTIAGTMVLWSPKKCLLMCKAPTMWWKEWSPIQWWGIIVYIILNICDFIYILKVWKSFNYFVFAFLLLLRRFNPAEPVVEQSVILQRINMYRVFPRINFKRIHFKCWNKVRVE